jgi:hypothetical protein
MKRPRGEFSQSVERFEIDVRSAFELLMTASADVKRDAAEIRGSTRLP